MEMLDERFFCAQQIFGKRLGAYQQQTKFLKLSILIRENKKLLDEFLHAFEPEEEKMCMTRFWLSF